MEHDENTLNEGRQDPELVRSMFNAIAPTYDALNHLLSFGMDFGWRRKAIALLEEKRGGSILDLACGSGDLSLDALALDPRLIVSTDFALQMLKVFAEKIQQKELSGAPLRLLACDAMRLPFIDASFDLTMVAFGIRNFADRLVSLKEMHRVLHPGGTTLILELTAPKHPLVAAGYALYTKGVLPLIGKIVSRHNAAYAYLPASIARFPESGKFLGMMKEAGFADCKAIPLSFGVATIFIGTKRK